MEARSKLAAITVTDGDGHVELVVEIEIDCPACGGVNMRLMGHHVRMLHLALGRVIELRPGLCGEGGVIDNLLDFSGGSDQAAKAGLN